MGHCAIAPVGARLCGALQGGGRHFCTGIESKEVRRLLHTPVLLNQVMSQFDGRSLRSFVDCTVGAGGHAAEILKAHPELCHFVGFDLDERAIVEARNKLEPINASRPDLRLELVQANFRDLRKVLQRVEVPSKGVDGILMDLGVSSMQVDDPERGFSYHLDGPLDMRMDSSAELKATTILNEWPEAEIGRILRDYGEEKRWKFLARRIVDARPAGGVASTTEFVKLIGGRFYTGKNQKMKHPSMRTFQALRIAVNDELKSLESTLSQALSCLNPGGRLAVISFHSLEDRIVKHHFLNVSSRRDRPSSTSGLDVDANLQFELSTKKPLVPDSEEMESNPRSRSAKLRVIQRI